MELALISVGLLAGVGASAISGLLGVRYIIQRDEDRLRGRYVINFPGELDFESVMTFIRGLSGLARPGMHGTSTIGFEVEADEKGIRHYLTVPHKHATYVIGQLRGHIPGSHVEKDESEPTEWTEAIELRMTSGRVPLPIPNPIGVISTLLSSMSGVKPGQRMLMQWVFAPAKPEASSKEDKPHQVKQSDRTFLAVGRLASKAESRQEAQHLVRRMFIGLSGIKAAGVAFRPRRIPGVIQRVNDRRTPLSFPCVLNVGELATLIAFPAGSLHIPGLPQSMAKHIPADPAIATEGFFLAKSNFPGAERPIAIRPNDLLKHMLVIGQTGVGKSNALLNLSVQIMEQGYGMMLLEPKGDLVDDVLNSIPEGRIKDVILFDPADTAFPIGLNILADPDPERITGHIVALFKGIYGESWGPRLEQILRYAVLTAALNGLSLYDVKQLLTNPGFRKSLMKKLKNPDVREFWQGYERMADNVSDSVVNKLDAFLGYSVIRNIVGQPKSGFDMSQVLSEGKILLVPLSSGMVGDANSAMLGSLIVSLAWQAARGRAGISRDDRKPFFLVVDEFQNFLNLPVAIGDALAQARGYGLGLVLANQHLAQLSPSVRAAVLQNARNKIVFQTGADDAKALAAEFAPYVHPHDFQTLGRYETVMKLLSDDVSTPPATGRMPGPPRSTRSAWAVREASRRDYARPLVDVELDFLNRHKQSREETKKPTFGRQDDGS